MFKESLNEEGILNQTVIVPNMASLGVASSVADSAFLRIPFSLTLRQYKTRPVVSTTIHNYFFNLTDPIL